eukprot:TRINITY_DN24070_c0_g1_i3.p1 TRINITY_DN24070_c0_g1~~TRINITY_DN24070_c0_g1_i3.p1  ORF type:complete len:163 (+),score=31.91 TRINITY_DN24070_c0_g1_i3:203-691(+)
MRVRSAIPSHPGASNMYKPNRNRTELLGDRANARYAEVSDQTIEQQNNDYAAQLSERVNALKGLTIDIGEEVKQQNRMLDGMVNPLCFIFFCFCIFVLIFFVCGELLMKQSDFGSAGQFLSSTMKKLSDMMSSGGSKNMCYLALAAFFIFVLLYFLIARKSA